MARESGIVAMLILSCASYSAAAQEFGRYRCKVEEVYGVDELGKSWKQADLLYDADAGTLDGSFDPGEDLQQDGLRIPPARLFSRLKVQTPPSRLQNLHAVQFDPAPTQISTPIVAWIMIETIDSGTFPRFQFFANTIRSLAAGRCVRDL